MIFILFSLGILASSFTIFVGAMIAWADIILDNNVISPEATLMLTVGIGVLFFSC